MEAILQKLLLPDNEQIKQGTQELRVAFKNPEAVPELCQLLSSSGDPRIRQYAAVLLRKKLRKSKNWSSLLDPARQTIKEGCLKSLLAEKEQLVKHSIAHLIGSIAKHELQGKGWPELMAFINQYIMSSEKEQRLFGMYCLSVLSENAGKVMKPFYGDFVKLVEQAIQNKEEPLIGFYAIRALTHIIGYIGSNELKSFQPLVGHLIVYMPILITFDQEKACEAMEIFDELFVSESAIVVSYIKPIFELCMRLAAEKTLDDNLRAKGINFLGEMVRHKKKTVVKHKLHEPMIKVLFEIMCEEGEDAEEEDEDIADNASANYSACHALDTMAMNLPPQKFMQILLSHITPALQSNDPLRLKGAFNAIAASVEGCSEYIRKECLLQFLNNISLGIEQENYQVRNAALYALGQFSEYLQPDINQYAAKILPILLTHLDKSCSELKAGDKLPMFIERLFYAIEMFLQNLEHEEEKIPYVPQLMNRFVSIMNADGSIKLKELAISGVGGVVDAAGDEILPYFQDLMVPLKKFLTMQHNDESQVLLTQSMDTLGYLARALGPTAFGRDLAEECCRLGLEMVNKHDDPDVRKCAFALFASVGFVVKEDIGNILPGLVQLMLNSVASKEGISLEYEDDGSGLPLEGLSDDEEEEDISIEPDDDSSDDKLKAVNLENAYMEEKMQAILALRELCQHSGAAFYPYLNQCLEETWKVVEFIDEDVRKSVIEALTMFTGTYYKCQTPEALAAFDSAIKLLIPKLCTIVTADVEVDVVCTALDSLSHILKLCKTGVTSISGHPEMIAQCIQKVLTSECQCMDNDEETEDGEEAEQDELLFEYVGDVLPSLGMAMDPQTFAPCFAEITPLLLKKNKNNCSDADKLVITGSLAQCMVSLKGCLDNFVPHLFPVLLEFLEDENDGVRNNAIFGIGEMVLHGISPVTAERFPQILQTLSNMLAKESKPRIIDQIIGAVCRLILAKKDSVMLNEVFPVLVQHLPLKEDFDEYKTVFMCVNFLFKEGDPIILENAGRFIEVSSQIVDTEECDKEKVEPLVAEFLTMCQKTAPESYNNVMSGLNRDVALKLQRFKI